MPLIMVTLRDCFELHEAGAGAGARSRVWERGHIEVCMASGAMGEPIYCIC